MKNILYIDLSSFQNHKVPKSPQHNFEILRQTRLFQKYFPKYLKKFSLSSKNGFSLSKVKRTKIIQNFETASSLLRPKSWRLLLANKSKTVQNLQNSHEAFFQFPEQIRFLPNLHEIHAIMPAPTSRTSTEPDKELDFYLKKSCRMLNHLRNLQCLKISELSRNHKNFLISLNKCQRFLSSLKKFILCWNETITPSSNYNLLYAMPIHKNLSKYVTSLDLGNLCIPAHFFNFQYLAATVPQLTRLAFRYDPPKVYSKEIGNFFEALKKFQNLKSLDIKIVDLFMFIKGFVPPPAIQNLKLSFQECFSKEMMQKFDRNFVECDELELLRIFKEHEMISRFCKNLQAVHSLKSLETIWEFDPSKKIGNFEKYQNCFSKYLLTGFTSLENLTFQMSATKPGSPQDSWSFDLSQFLKSCLGSSDTLTTLEIRNEYFQFPQFDLSGLEKKFPKLSSIKVTGEFVQDDGSYFLLKQLVFLGNSLQKIKLQVFLGDNIESYVALLQRINQLEKPSQVKIEVQIQFEDDLQCEDLENFIYLVNISQKKDSTEGIYFRLMIPINWMSFRKFNYHNIFTNIKKRIRHVCQEKFKNCEILNSGDSD